MAIEKRGKAWQARLRVRGMSASATFASKREAQAWEAAKRLEFEASVNSTETRRNSSIQSQSSVKVPTMREAVGEALKYHWRGTKGEDTARTNINDVAEIIGWKEPITVLNNPKTIYRLRDTLEKRGLSVGTINRKLAALSVIYSLNDEVLHKPRAARLKREANNGRVRVISREEEAKMLMWCDENDAPALRAFVELAIYTGLRRGEIFKLRRIDIHDYSSSITLVDTKNNDTVTIAVVELALKAAITWVAAPLTEQQVRTRWTRMKKDIGLLDDPEFCIHAMRHTFCTSVVRGGASLQQLQALSRHKSVEVANRYVHLNRADQEVALEAALKAPR